MLSNLNSWTLKLLTKVAQTNINGAVVGNKYTFRARVSFYCTAAGWSMCSSCASRVLPLQLSHRVRHQFFWLINTLRSLKIPEGHLTRFTAVLKLFPESLKTLLTIWMKNYSIHHTLKKDLQPISQVATVSPSQVAGNDISRACFLWHKNMNIWFCIKIVFAYSENTFWAMLLLLFCYFF